MDEYLFRTRSIEIRETLLEPGDPARPNEDAIRINTKTGVIAVIDGLTSKADDPYKFWGNKEKGISDVSCFANALAQTLAHELDPDAYAHPVDMINAARQKLREEFDKIARHIPAQPCEYPMASVAMMRTLGNGTLEFTNICDTEVLIQLPDRFVHLEEDQNHVRLENDREAMKNRLENEGVTDKKAQRTAILPIMRGHYNNFANTSTSQGGFGVVSLATPCLPAQAKILHVDPKHLKWAMMATDGLTEYFRQFTNGQRDGLDVSALGLQVMHDRIATTARTGSLNAKGFKDLDDVAGVLLVRSS